MYNALACLLVDECKGSACGPEGSVTYGWGCVHFFCFPCYLKHEFLKLQLPAFDPSLQCAYCFFFLVLLTRY